MTENRVPSEPTTPQAEPSLLVGDGEAKMEAALKPFGWKCGPTFWQRYYSDPWVFNLANAVERLSSARVEVGPSPANPEVLFGKILSAVIDKLMAANVLTRDDVETGEVERILGAIDDLVRALPSPDDAKSAAVGPSPEQITQAEVDAAAEAIARSDGRDWPMLPGSLKNSVYRAARSALVAACSVRGTPNEA